MRSDEQLERLLEDWLEDEAQPIPHDVLEGALESVARTPQLGPRGGRAGWFMNGPLGMAVAAAFVVLAVLTGIVVRDRIGSDPTPSASAGPSMVWAQPSDFRADPSRNPGPDSHGNVGIWSYLSGPAAHVPATYDLLRTFADNQWSDRAFINLNVSADRGLVLHPYRDDVQTRYIVLGWQSPVSGDVTVSGSADLLQRTCPGPADGVELLIDHGSETVAITPIAAGGTEVFEVTVAVSPGESIYFVVDPRANSSCDATALNFTIRTGR
jgi:hypothetical protein